MGRDAEIDQLRRALRQASQGHGQIAAVIGEAGVGKSRLVHELIRSHRVHDWLVLESGSVSYGSGQPLAAGDRSPQGLLPDRGARRPSGDAREGHGEAPHPRPRARADPARAALAPAGARRRSRVDRPGPSPAPPAHARCRPAAAPARGPNAAASSSSSRTSHWIDSESQALLDALVESLPVARLLLLVNYRPEYQHAWATKSYYTQIRLDALPEERAGELLEALVGDDPTLAPLKALLLARTRGNPFFLEESVRTLVETRIARGRAGRVPADASVETIQVPETVHAILAARIDRLAPTDKQLLQSAAVVGTEVPLPLLQAVAETPDEDLRRGLAHLQAAEYALRDEPLSRGGVHVQARPHSRGRLREPAPRATPHAARRGSSPPSSRATPTDWPSTSSGSDIMRFVPRPGTRPWATCVGPASRPPGARPTGRRLPPSGGADRSGAPAGDPRHPGDVGRPPELSPQRVDAARRAGSHPRQPRGRRAAGRATGRRHPDRLAVERAREHAAGDRRASTCRRGGAPGARPG